MTTDTTTRPQVPARTVERVLYNQVDATTLSQMAYMKRQEDPRVRARQALTPEGLDRLAEIIDKGSFPTIGFFRRFRAA